MNLSADSRKPLFVLNSAVPIRICDNGGWTDTWFAGHGRIFNIGVSPYAEVQINVYAGGDPDERIVIHVENYGERYAVRPGAQWDRHPLLEAAIESMHVRQELSLEISIFSEAPSGASTGTSSAVAVALIGALDCLASLHDPAARRMSPYEVAMAAQRVETELLGQQCGIQDQLCSAYGGINYIEMERYPEAFVTQIQLPDPVWWELERRLALVYLGKSHHSSSIHEMVIRGLENAGPECRQLADLRLTASQSRDALCVGDFTRLGAAMVANTEAQQRLHPSLVGSDAARVIEIARQHGALGWKVNGAGGEGGSLTILGNGRSDVKRAMLREIEQENPLYRNIPIYLSRAGLRVWKQEFTPPS